MDFGIPYFQNKTVYTDGMCLTLPDIVHWMDLELWSSAPILCQEDANGVQQGSHEAFGFRVRIFQAGGVKKMHQLALDHCCDITGHSILPPCQLEF